MVHHVAMEHVFSGEIEEARSKGDAAVARDDCRVAPDRVRQRYEVLPPRRQGRGECRGAGRLRPANGTERPRAARAAGPHLNLERRRPLPRSLDGLLGRNELADMTRRLAFIPIAMVQGEAA
jgi:hypothetical protein